MAASRRGRPFRLEMRFVVYAASALAGLVALIFAAVAIHDVRVAAALRARGIVAQGRQTDVRCSESRSSNGRTTRSCVGEWSYRTTAGARFTMDDLGVNIVAPAATAPGWAPPRDGQIVYLPDRPGTARLRTQVAPDPMPMLIGGGMFLLMAVVFFAAGHRMLGPERRRAAPRPTTGTATRRPDRRGRWITGAMLVGIPLAVIAGLLLV